MDTNLEIKAKITIIIKIGISKNNLNNRTNTKTYSSSLLSQTPLNNMPNLTLRKLNPSKSRSLKPFHLPHLNL